MADLISAFVMFVTLSPMPSVHATFSGWNATAKLQHALTSASDRRRTREGTERCSWPKHRTPAGKAEQK